MHLAKLAVADRLPKGSIVQVAALFGLSARTVSNVWKMRVNTEALTATSPTPKARPTKLSPREVAQRVTDAPKAARQSLRSVAEATGIPKSTLARYRAAGYFRRACSRVKPKLTDAHKQKRLKFALGHVHRPIGTCIF